MDESAKLVPDFAKISGNFLSGKDAAKSEKIEKHLDKCLLDIKYEGNKYATPKAFMKNICFLISNFISDVILWKKSLCVP